jgi:hypothetical protein
LPVLGASVSLGESEEGEHGRDAHGHAHKDD